MPLKPESPASWPIWVSSAVNCVERLARTVVSVVCWAWLTRDWADCTSFVIDVMPLFAAWMVLIALDIEFEQTAQVAGAVVQGLGREVVERIVESRVDPLAGGQLGLGAGDQVRRLLQLQQVGPHASGEDDA